MPENFHNELTEKLVLAEKKTKKHIWVKYAAVAACACIVFITGGYIKSGFSSYFKAGAATGMDYNSASAGSVQEFSATADAASKVSADTGAYDDNYSADMANNTESAVSAGIHGEKLIKNGYISVSVDDYDKAEKNIKDYILQNNGYIQNSSSYSDYDHEFNLYRGKSGSMTVCIESDKFGLANVSWLTGTAAWMYIAVTQYMLGIRAKWDGLEIDPCLPKELLPAKVTRVFRGKKYNNYNNKERKNLYQDDDKNVNVVI